MNLTTLTTTSSIPVNFLDIIGVSNYVLGLLKNGLNVFGSDTLNQLQAYDFIEGYRMNSDVFMYDPVTHFGFAHSVRGLVSVDKWTGIGGILLPFQLIGGVVSQNESGIELIYTGDEFIFDVLSRNSDGNYLVMDLSLYLIGFSF